jgi:hypothetical protein
MPSTLKKVVSLSSLFTTLRGVSTGDWAFITKAQNKSRKLNNGFIYSGFYTNIRNDLKTDGLNNLKINAAMLFLFFF